MPSRLPIIALCVALFVPTPARAQPNAKELNDAGWKLIESGKPAAAAQVFSEALETRPDEPVLLLGVGVAAHMQGRSSEARPPLTRALQREPRLTPASLILGELAYADGDVTQAIAIYEKALTYAPTHPDLTSRLRAWRADAEAGRGSTERRVDRFRVLFQGHADSVLAARATDILDAAFWRVGRALDMFPSDAVGVTLYTEQQFRDVTQAPEWSGGVYDGRIRVPTAGAARDPALFERVLRHELTHAMISSVAPRGVPVWLHEGLAQHFAGSDAVAARQRLRRSGVIPLQHLEGSFMGLTGPQARVAYDESLVVVETLLRRRSVSWGALFEALARSDRTEYTLDQFGVRYGDLEAEVARGN